VHESYLGVFANVQAAFGEQAFADFDHFMAGRPIAELQTLGAWKVGTDGEAVCALRARATTHGCDQTGNIFGHTWVRDERGSTHKALIDLAPRPGLEPGTCGLTVRRLIARKAAPVNDLGQNGR
jgi:hypothetical protein